MTLFASCQVGTSSFVSLTFLGFGPFIFFLPSNLCHVVMTTDPMDPKTAKLPVVSPICSRVVLLQLHLPLILCIIQNHLRPLVSHQWCGIHYVSPSTWSLSINFNSLSGKLTERLPSSTLDLACPNGNFFTLDDKFTSFAFNRVISQVFDFSSSIHILWIVLIVPWWPLSLLVISLALVNSLHHWLVIKWLSSMFDVSTSIHMLESVLLSGRVGPQDPGLGSQKVQVVKWCDMVMMICMCLSDDWLQPDHELSYVILLIIGWLRPYNGFIMILFDGWLCTYLDPFTWTFSGWLCPCHDSCLIWQRSQFMYMYLYFLAGFPTAD